MTANKSERIIIVVVAIVIILGIGIALGVWIGKEDARKVFNNVEHPIPPKRKVAGEN